MPTRIFLLGTAFVFALGTLATASAAKRKRRSTDPAKSEVSEVSMFVGQQEVIAARNIDSYSESTSGIVQIKIPSDASKMVVTAVKAGRTSLLLIYRDGTHLTRVITVQDRPLSLVKEELEELYDDVPGVVVREIGSRLFVEVRMPEEQGKKLVEELRKAYGDQLAAIVLKTPERTANIKLDVHFVEFSRRSGYVFGMNWPDQFGLDGELAATYDFNARAWSARTFTISSRNLVALDFLSFGGWAKILKNSTIVTANGAEARFRAGGELNVPLTGIGGGKLEKIPFGLDVTVIPNFDPRLEKVELEVKAEAAELSEGIFDTPGRTLTDLKTIVQIEPGQSLMLSGVRSLTAKEKQSGWPLFRHIPILGYFFRSDDHAESDLEGAVFITPTIVEEVGEADRKRLQEMIKRYKAFEGDD